MDYTATVNIGDRVKSLWDGTLGTIAMSCELRRTGGTVVVRWDNSHQESKEIWLCDVEPIKGGNMDTHEFVVIRKGDNNSEYIDITTISGCRDWAHKKAIETDAHIPQWAKENPIARIAQIHIKEC